MTGDRKVVWIALGMDSVARNYLRACVWVSVLCCLSLHLLNSFCLSLFLALLGASVMSRRGMTASACLGGETQGSWGFLGIQLSCLLQWCWSWLWLLEWEQHCLVAGAESWSRAALASMVEVHGNPYQSALACRQWIVCQVLLRCVPAGTAFCLGVLLATGAGHLWPWPAFGLLYAEHKPLSEAFFRKFRKDAEMLERA